MASLAVVALGSNLVQKESGATSPADMISLGLSALAGVPGAWRVRSSSVWQTEPEKAEGGVFANAVALVDFRSDALQAEQLLDCLLEIEVRLGRDRSQAPPSNGLSPARSLDLDLIWFNGECSSSPRLVLPHPRAYSREFVLGPLAELAPSLRLRPGGPSVGEALTALRSVPTTCLAP